MRASRTEDPTMIGRYEIRGMLGEGTMGIVYHGWDSRLERNVAIKVLSPQSDIDSNRAEQIARFLREAKITSALKHPHIVEVYDIGDDPVTGMSYLVMEFVNGISLQRILKERHLTTEEILTLVCQVADGLDYAAQFTIVHRDIKPANILVDPISLLPKLLDFGIAKRENTDVTHCGSICGTPHYMSPEQCRGDALDARSDIFSLGSVLYEMLTDRKAFPGETLASVMTGILDPDLPMPPSQLCPGIAGAVEGAAMKALAKNPADRFQRGKEFIAALEAARSEAPEPLMNKGGGGLRSMEDTMLVSAAVGPPARSVVHRLAPRLPQTSSARRYLYIGVMCAIVAMLLAITRDWINPTISSPLAVNFGIIKEDQGKILLMDEHATLFPYDNFALILRPEQASYLYVWQIDSSGRVLRLFPNAEFNDQINPVSEGAEVWLPAAKTRHRWFHLDLHAGKEEFVVVVAAMPVAEIERALKMFPLNGSADPTTNRIILKALLAAGEKVEVVREITKAQFITQKSEEVPTWSLKGTSKAFSYRVILKHS
ncbi:MAG: protein kinase [Nitrospirales bacterium]